jgi:hypothetical protein
MHPHSETVRGESVDAHASRKRPGVSAGTNGSTMLQNARLLLTLPTTPELAREIDTTCAQLHTARKNRRFVEEEIKLQYYFGGQEVAYVRTRNGIAVVVSGRPDTSEVKDFLEKLSKEECAQVVIHYPDPWVI